MVTKEQIELWSNQLLIIESPEGHVYHTQIMKIEKDQLFIQMPQGKEPGTRELVQGRVTVYFFNEQKDLIGYRTELKRAERFVTVGLPTTENAWKVQRRQFFRVPAQLNASIQWTEEEAAEFATVDISGGGFSFIITDQALDKNIHEVVEGKLQDSQQKLPYDIPFKGKIADKREHIRGGVLFAVEFTQIDERHREQIIRYCNKRQQELRYKFGNNRRS